MIAPDATQCDVLVYRPPVKRTYIDVSASSKARCLKLIQSGEYAWKFKNRAGELVFSYFNSGHIIRFPDLREWLLVHKRY
jgi:hypothetical protein